jgi:hypothetical protein
MQIAKIDYKGWPNAYRLANGSIELVVTTDVGPRIIFFGFMGDQNEFKEYPDQIGQTGGEDWCIYGGHRLWHAPESIPRSYSPDNSPVCLQEYPGFVRLTQPVEATTGIQKEIEIALDAEAPHVRVTHRLRNINLWEVELAPWAMSVMAAGGVAILPLPPRQSHQQNLQPTHSITLWAYTDMTDPRWTWGKTHLLLRQDEARKDPQKIGLMAPDGWIAYARQGHLFVKRAGFVSGAAYPDYGSSLEVFTNDEMLEMETLGPLSGIEPKGAAEHVEDWYLFSHVPSPQNDEDVQVHILPIIAAMQARQVPSDSSSG